jgi:hypothetical protein
VAKVRYPLGVPRAGASIALLALLAACSDEAFVGSQLLWSSDHESGRLDDWAAGMHGGSAVDVAEDSIAVSDERAHRGRYAVKLTKVVGSSVPRGGPRLFRTGDLPAHAFYSAWFFVPVQYETRSYWTIFKFDSTNSTGPVYDRGIDLELRSLPDGGYVLEALFHSEAYLRAPLPNPPPLVAPNQWFHIEAELWAESDTTGSLAVWLDGRRVYDLVGRPTIEAASLEFMVANLLEDVAPSPVELFVDDVAVSATRVTPAGHLTR